MVSYSILVLVSALVGRRKNVTRTTETARFDGISRRELLKAGTIGIGTVGLAGCIGANTPQDTPTPELNLETLEADTEYGSLQAARAENSYVSLIDEGQAIGIAFLDEVGAGANHDLDDGIVVHLYDRKDYAIMIGEIDTEGAATLASEEGNDFDATVELTMEDDVVSGTVSFEGESSSPFTADAATGVGGVYWAHGTDEEPDASGDWVVLSDGRQWGCVCVPPTFSNPCCHLRS